MGREGEDPILQAKYRWREISDLKSSVMCFHLICTTYVDPHPSSFSCAESPREMEERGGLLVDNSMKPQKNSWP